jgi:iron complex outermembrane receptor protein
MAATALLISLGATAPAFAQSAPPATKAGDEVVQLDAFKVTTSIETYHQTSSSMASKLPMDTKELASSLSILNASAITDRNAVVLTDVVAYVVGATASQNSVNGFSFRGFPNTGSYTQNIQYDGLMGATLKKGGASASNVDSLEFLKGPNGVLYGQMNPGGLLNIVTKNPKEISETTVRTTVATFAGKFNNFGDKTNETISLDTTGPVANSSHLFYRVVVDVGHQPSSRPGNWDNSLSVYPALTYKWTPETQVTLKFESSEDFRRQDDGVIPIFTNNTAFGATAYYYTAPLNTVYNDAKDKATDRGQAAAMKFQTTLPGDWNLRVQSRSVWHLDVVRELTVNNANTFNPTSTFAKPTSTLRRQYNYVKNGHRYNFVDANIYHTFTTGKLTQIVLAGVGGGGEFFGNARLAFGPNQLVTQAIPLTNPLLDQFAYPADGTGATNQVTWQNAFGEYISDQIKFGDSLHLSAGFRHDRQRVHGANTLAPALTTFATELKANTKQLGLVYDLTSNVSAYTSWSQSIKPQTNIAYDASGNSNFPPETGEQYEGGLKFDTASKNLNVTLAGYEINRTNVVVASGTNFTVPTGSAQVGQAISRLDGKQTSKGIEAEVQWQPIPNWQLQAGYAYSKAIIAASIKNPTTVGLDLANAPRVSGNFWTRYNFKEGGFKGFGVGTGVIYVGKAWAGDPTTTVYYNMPGWARVDSSAYYTWKKYRFSLNIQNLLDRRYISSAQSALTLNMGEERKFTFSASTKF